MWPLIARSTAHSCRLCPDGTENREREGARGAAGEAPAGGEGLRGGSVVTAGGRGSSREAVASPEMLLRGGKIGRASCRERV